MSRNEIVRLVSRALAVIQFVSALEEISYLPRYLFAVHHYGGGVGSSYLEYSYQLDAAFLFARIAIFLTVAWMFWYCGPRIARLLLPLDDGSIQSNDGPRPGSEGPALS